MQNRNQFWSIGFVYFSFKRYCSHKSCCIFADIKKGVMVEEILAYNKEFVKNKGYEKYITNKYPDKKVAIVSCMDTRLTELLPAALGLKNGDVKIIKNAGGTVTHPFGSAMRSLLVAIYELGVIEIMIIGHTDCGIQSMDSRKLITHMKERGISERRIEMMRYCGIDFESWLSGFDCVESSVKETVELVRKHPLVPADITVFGYVMNSVTGELVFVP